MPDKVVQSAEHTEAPPEHEVNGGDSSGGETPSKQEGKVRPSAKPPAGHPCNFDDPFGVRKGTQF
jgi:hypothetical protein